MGTLWIPSLKKNWTEAPIKPLKWQLIYSLRKPQTLEVQYNVASEHQPHCPEDIADSFKLAELSFFSRNVDGSTSLMGL